MKVKFCGAAREVTGSAHLVKLDNGYKILLDCGLYQGNDKEMADFNSSWGFDPAEVDCLILSHAHIDHAGRIPKLIRDGFKGKIFCTHATRSLCALMLLDSGRIQEREASWKSKRQKKKIEPLYTAADAKIAMNRFESYGYNNWVRVRKGVRMMFRDSGHILGSASVTLSIREKGKRKIKLGFTGDIGRPNRPILRDPIPMPELDYLISESTYGNKEHAAPPNETNRFLEIIKKTCVENKGKVLIPAFSVGRTQEIVYMLDQLHTANLLPRIPVYVDSPLSVNTTKVFGAHPECYDEDLSEYLLIDDNPFGFNSLTYVHKQEESKKLNESDEPCIIIASAGMINAGRIKHHVYHNIEKPECTILIVGYCSPRTPGGALRAGKKKLKLFGEILDVKAKVELMDSFSAHADRLEMVDFMKNQKNLKKLFLVHGQYDTQEAFGAFLEKNGIGPVVIPTLYQEIELN